jgi:hypothetical protein
MATKIQINDLKALQALLSVDPEFEVEFRNAVVTELHKRIIVPTVDRRVQALVEAEVNHALGVQERYGGRITLTPEVAEVIKTAVEKEAHSILCGVVKEITDKVLSKTIIQDNVIHSATVRAVEEYKTKVREAVS